MTATPAAVPADPSASADPSADDVAVVILAAGQGTRFRSDTAKVLHRAAGRTLVGHVLEAVRPLGVGQVVVVVGHQGDEVAADVEAAGFASLVTVTQHEQRGTGHAVQQAVPALADGIRRVLILPGDTPLLTSEALHRLIAATGDAAGAMLTFEPEDPTGYGRVLREDDGTVERIVEHRDASEAELRVREANAGMYLVERGRLVDALDRLDDDNAQGELYLTDIVTLLRRDGHAVVPILVPEEVVAGVNDRAQLADAAARLRRRHLDHLMREVGVSVIDPATTYLDVDVEVGRDTVLLPGTMLERGTRVGEGATIGPNTRLVACVVEDGATVESTRADNSVIGARADVGPFTHLRAGTRLEAGAKAGAFVQMKNASMGVGAKAGHLAYVGDATVGAGANIGAGVVVVNYDGHDKHHTVVEDGGFVGSGTMLVAPVTVGAGAYIAAGSTITEDVPADALAIARSRQTNKEGRARGRRRGR